MMHKYYCEPCRRFIFADTLVSLVERLNYHNHTQHPQLSDQWNAGILVQSRNYEPAEDAPLYVTPSPVGSNMKLEELTPYDRKFLSGILIKWD